MVKDCQARLLIPLLPKDVGHGACIDEQKLGGHPIADLVFASKARNMWNNLPASIVHCTCVDSFRDALDAYRMKDPNVFSYTFTSRPNRKVSTLRSSHNGFHVRFVKYSKNMIYFLVSLLFLTHCSIYSYQEES